MVPVKPILRRQSKAHIHPYHSTRIIADQQSRHTTPHLSADRHCAKSISESVWRASCFSWCSAPSQPSPSPWRRHHHNARHTHHVKRQACTYTWRVCEVRLCCVLHAVSRVSCGPTLFPFSLSLCCCPPPITIPFTVARRSPIGKNRQCTHDERMRW